MSRTNKVNPSQYTQAGRLTPDDAAREFAKQRQSMSGSHGNGNPTSRSEAWMHQAEKAREIAVGPSAPASTWIDSLVGGLGSLGAGLGAIGILAGRQLARTPALRGRDVNTVRTAAFLMANAAAICLSVYCTRRLTSSRRS